MHTTIVAPTCPVPECTLTVADIESLLPALDTYAELFASAFARSDQHAWARRYLHGLLLPLPRKSCEPIALALDVSVRRLQSFISESTWSATSLLTLQEHLVARSLADADDGVFLIDESGMPKQGLHSAGVARQYCGALGKVCSCQVGVFVAYASAKGYTLLASQLFVPENWFADDFAALRHDVGVPSDLAFLTKPQIAAQLLQAIAARGILQGRWVASDALYGNSPAFRDAVDALDKWYFTEVSSDQLIWRRIPALIIPPWSGRGRKPTKKCLKTPSNAPYRVDDLLRRLPKNVWTRATIQEGSKGPIICDLAFVRVTEARDGLPGPRLWLIIRRNVDDPTVVKFYLSNAPETIETTRLARMCGMRWPIELTFEVGKDELGMDQYETRGWVGWHHHMALVMVAHRFLVWARQMLLEKAPALTLCQVRLLLTSVIPRPNVDAARALFLVVYYQRRNHAAYLSHLKRKQRDFARIAEQEAQKRHRYPGRPPKRLAPVDLALADSAL
jgi:SRSO17 transposase